MRGNLLKKFNQKTRFLTFFFFKKKKKKQLKRWYFEYIYVTTSASIGVKLSILLNMMIQDAKVVFAFHRHQ